MPPIPPRRRKSDNALPGWMLTFADLMTLLLTFFILLLSFSKMDVAKYKAIAQSMEKAFGGRPVIITTSGPGASIVSKVVPSTSRPQVTSAPGALTEPVFIPENAPRPKASNVVPKGIETLATRLIDQFEAQIASGDMKVQYNAHKVTVRFPEDATFPSGSARLKAKMKPIIDRMVKVLAECPGKIEVDGYTDNQPIVSSKYRSNWDLSAARAVSVVHELIMNRRINAEDVTAAGHAETNPLVPNDTPAHRAMNRRVEINIRQPDCQASARSTSPRASKTTTATPEALKLQ